VKKVKITVKDKAGNTVFKDFLYTNGTKSEIHRKQEGHGHDEHGKDKHGEKHEKKDGHDTPGKHADPHQHAPDLDDDVVYNAPAETATDTANVEASADTTSPPAEEPKEETSPAACHTSCARHRADERKHRMDRQLEGRHHPCRIRHRAPGRG
jgi:hypothetical protein